MVERMRRGAPVIVPGTGPACDRDPRPDPPSACRSLGNPRALGQAVHSLTDSDWSDIHRGWHGAEVPAQLLHVPANA